MAKVILICGKIASGKSWYCQDLLKKHPALLLSVDELSTRLGPLGDQHDAYCHAIQEYMLEKAVEAVRAGVDVILDWGFWTREDRRSRTKFFQERGITIEWHYIHVPETVWQENIARRNAAVLSGTDSSYYVDEGLMEKLLSLFEPPEPGEMDVTYTREG